MQLEKLLKEEWGLTVKKLTPVRSAWRVEAEEGIFACKFSRSNPERLKLLVEAQEYLLAAGFNRFARLVPTRTGQWLVQPQEKACLLTTWVNGEEPSYYRQRDLLAVSRVLGQFHRVACQFPAARVGQGKDKLGQWPRKLEKKKEELVQSLELARQEGNRDLFSIILLSRQKWLLEMAREAVEAVRHSPYQQLVESYQREGLAPLCHGDTAMRNFLLRLNGGQTEGWLIDFDSLAVDLPVVDLWRLLRRSLRRNYWSQPLAFAMLRSYHRERKMTREEVEVLTALLTFPEKEWRLAKAYYHQLDQLSARDKCQWAGKLLDLVAGHEDKEALLQQLPQVPLTEEYIPWLNGLGKEGADSENRRPG
ncbi:MAG: CotS family spore coat protein [Bacillota bacterium]